MRLELLAPICKRERGKKKKKRSDQLDLLPEVSLPALDRSIDRFYTKAFLSWSDLVCPLPTQEPYLSLPGLPPRSDGDAQGVDVIASLTDI